MAYGILFAVQDGKFQIIGEVDSLAEAQVMALTYETYGPDCNWLAPEHFEIHRRDEIGAYTRIERMEA